MNGYAIRPAVPADCAALAAMWRDSVVTLCTADHHGDAGTIARWTANKTPDGLRAALANPATVWRVAVAPDGAIAGVAGLNNDGEVTACYVSPAHVRRGVGRALLQAIKAAARTAGMTRLFLHSTATAREFYRRLGFAPTGGTRCCLCTVTAYTMELPLAPAVELLLLTREETMAVQARGAMTEFRGRRCAADDLVPAIVAAMALLREQNGEAWLWCAPYLLLDPHCGVAVGAACFKNSPSPDSVEIGYGVAAGETGRGYATAGVAAMLAAAAQLGAATVTANTSVANPASARVLVNNGFVRTGQRHDPEDGLLDCWECRLLQIADAGTDDAPAILALQRLAFRTEAELYDDWSLPALTQPLAELQAELRNCPAVKAVRGGRMIGAVRVRLDGMMG